MTTHWYSCARCLAAEGRTTSTQAILMDSKSQEPTSQPRLVGWGYLLPSVWQLFHLISPNLWSKAEAAGEKIQPWEWDKVLLVVGTLLQMCPQGTLTYTILVFTNKMQQSVKSLATYSQRWWFPLNHIFTHTLNILRTQKLAIKDESRVNWWYI